MGERVQEDMRVRGIEDSPTGESMIDGSVAGLSSEPADTMPVDGRVVRIMRRVLSRDGGRMRIDLREGFIGDIDKTTATLKEEVADRIDAGKDLMHDRMARFKEYYERNGSKPLQIDVGLAVGTLALAYVAIRARRQASESTESLPGDPWRDRIQRTGSRLQELPQRVRQVYVDTVRPERN